MSYYNGEDKATIAKSKGISVTTLYKQISRIKKKLIQILGGMHK